MNPRYSMATWPASRPRRYGISVLHLLHGTGVTVHRDGEVDRAGEQDGDLDRDVRRHITGPVAPIHAGTPSPRPRQMLQRSPLAHTETLPPRRRRPRTYALVRSIPRERV